MMPVSPIRFSCFFLWCILHISVAAQVTDSLPIAPQLTEPAPLPMTTLTESRIYNPNAWRPELSLGVTIAPEAGMELTYRQMRRDKGIELSLFALPITVDKSQFFTGSITNEYLDYRSDTFSIQPYRNITGAWRTIQNQPMALAPAIVTTAFGGANLSIPFHFWSNHKLLRVQVAPGLGLYHHRYLRVQDAPLKSTESSVVYTFGQQPFQVRITEYFRKVEQSRTMTAHTDYLPFLSYSTLVGFQLTHRLWMEMGGTGAIQLKDYNVSEAPSITRQLSVRFRAGLVYRFKPGPKPVKPAKREVIRI